MAKMAHRSSYDRSAYGTVRGRRKAARAARAAAEASPAEARDAAIDALHDPSAGDGAPESGAAAFSRSRYSSAGAYSRSGSQSYAAIRKKRQRTRLVKRCLVAVLVLVLGTAGGAFGYLWWMQSSMNDGIDSKLLSLLARANAGDPFYMVLIGTDGSDDREASAEFAGDNFRSDSLMLARIDPQEQKVAVVSLMRDTQVDLGEDYGLQKINAAHAIGGPAATVQAVSELAGVPISHYAEINFDGFRAAVDALGGIDVDVAIEIDDPDAGGYVPAGQQTLDGEQALILCRARHAFDEYGNGDGYRAANQRLVVSAIASKLLDSDVGTMMSTVQTLAGYITTDLSVPDIVSLANSMRGINMEESFYTAVNPTISEYEDGIWWEVSDEAAWREMMRRIDQGLPPLAEDSVDAATGITFASAGGTGQRSGAVAIRNGSGISGLGAQAQEVVEALGYSTSVANANNSNYEETVVVYTEPGQRPYAEEIAEALGQGRVVQDDGNYIFKGSFLVLIGQDWH